MIKELEDQRQDGAAVRASDRMAVPVASGDSLSLSPREQVVLRLFATGQKGPDIARALGMSYRTLKRIIADLQEQLGAPSMFTLGMRSVELGLVPRGQQPLPESELVAGGGLRRSHKYRLGNVGAPRTFSSP